MYLFRQSELKMGDWEYFLGTMRMSQIANEVKFFYEIGDTEDLAELLQRGVSNRVSGIKDYLIESNHRFFGSIIVAVWDGDPKFLPIRMDEAEKGTLSADIDEVFGVLKFNGTQTFFALDGQHRLAAIKEAVAEDPIKFSDDFVSVVLVRHDANPEGMVKTRRLFTNLNKNAKKTARGEDIVLDEDDGASIITRRLIKEHDFFSKNERVKIFGGPRRPKDGSYTIAGKTIPQSDEKAVTTIVLVNQMVEILTDGTWKEEIIKNSPPSNSELERQYTLVSSKLDDLFKNAGNLSGRVSSGESPKLLRLGDGQGVMHGHAFMRPVVQLAVTKVVTDVVINDDNDLTWRQTMSRLSDLDWNIDAPLWSCIYNTETGTMISGKDFNQLLEKMLHVHIAPASLNVTKEAILTYERVMQTKWQGASANALAQKVVETA
jgi:DNA sulfur modification protein DndB